MTMIDKERAQAYLELAGKSTDGPWISSPGGEDEAASVWVNDHPYHPSTIAEELLRVDAEFIAASRTEGPYFAQSYLTALDEIVWLRKIEKAAIAVVNAESGDDIEENVGKLEKLMNGDLDFNPTEYAKGFLVSEVERLREEVKVITKSCDWNQSMTASVASQNRKLLGEIERLNTELARDQQEIRRLQQLYDDDIGVIATEAQILTELVEDQETADHLISELPAIAFYIAVEGKEGPMWRLVYGKKIQVKGFEFGVWFNGRAIAWSVTNFETGLSVTNVNELVEAEIITETIIDMVGIDEFRKTVQTQIPEVASRFGPRPAAPRVVWKAENEKAEVLEGVSNSEGN